MIRPYLLVLLATSLAGCKVGPDYQRPSAPIPDTYQEASATAVHWKTPTPADDFDRGHWWSIYQDPLLDELTGKVALDNQSIKSYAAAYLQALALTDAARATLSPQLALAPQVIRGRINSAGSAATSSGPAAVNSASGTSRTLEVTASWDLDLWGKLRRQVESNRAAAQASEAQLDAALLSAQAELVSDYFQLRYADALQALLQQTITAYQRTLDITRNQYDAGLAAPSDVVTAETQLQASQSQLIAVGLSRAQYEHAIALLVGRTPRQLTIPSAPLSAVVPEVPVWVPSELLERRPDIAQAERTAAQQSALIGVSVAAYYPNLTLSGLLGYAAGARGNWISASTEVWSAAASGSEILFDAGARHSTVSAARAAYLQSVANYRETVLNAFNEVETCLSSLRILAAQAAAQQRAVALSQRSVTIAVHEYVAGTQSYTTVAAAQATELGNEQIQLQITANRLLQTVALLKALGGDWTPP